MYYVTYVSRIHGSKKKHEHLRGVFCPDQSNEMEKKSCGAARKFENLKKTINMFIKIIKIVGTMAPKQYLNHSSSKKKKDPPLVIPTHAPLLFQHTATSSTDQGGTTNSNGPELFEESIFFHLPSGYLT